jgi:hypothetical protein
MAAIFVLGSRAWSIGTSGVPESASEVGVGSPTPDGASSTGAWLYSLSQMDDLNRSYTNTPKRWWFMTRPKSARASTASLSHAENMMKLETIKLLLELSDLLSVCHHAGVMIVQLPHDMVDDELRVIVDVKLLDPELDGDAHVVDEGLIFCYIVGRVEVQSNHIEEPISLGGDQHNTSPAPAKSERAIEVHSPVLLGIHGRRLLCLGPFRHEVRQSLEFECHFWHVGYVKPHELESPLGNPSHGEAISNNLPEPIQGNHTDWVALKVIKELAFHN